MSDEVYVLVRHKKDIDDTINAATAPWYTPRLWPWDRELPEGWEVIQFMVPYPSMVEAGQQKETLGLCIRRAFVRLNKLEGRIVSIESEADEERRPTNTPRESCPVIYQLGQAGFNARFLKCTEGYGHPGDHCFRDAATDTDIKAPLEAGPPAENLGHHAACPSRTSRHATCSCRSLYAEETGERSALQRVKELEGDLTALGSRVSRAIGPSTEDSSIHSLSGRLRVVESNHSANRARIECLETPPMDGFTPTSAQRSDPVRLRIDALESDLRDKLGVLTDRLDLLPFVPTGLADMVDGVNELEGLVNAIVDVQKRRSRAMNRVFDRLDVLESDTEDSHQELGPLKAVESPAGELFWTCKIGPVAIVPPNADLPLRIAVVDAFRKLIGGSPPICESGWGEDPLDTGPKPFCKTIITYGKPGNMSFYACLKRQGHPGKHIPGKELHMGPGEILAEKPLPPPDPEAMGKLVSAMGSVLDECDEAEKPEPVRPDPLDDPFSHETAVDLVKRFRNKRQAAVRMAWNVLPLDERDEFLAWAECRRATKKSAEKGD